MGGGSSRTTSDDIRRNLLLDTASARRCRVPCGLEVNCFACAHRGQDLFEVVSWLPEGMLRADAHMEMAPFLPPQAVCLGQSRV